ncbi:hypothetical protein RAS1_28970 [Phycisphaerae bacterium RAS1]|nr:hypothetical protein RAS1_28970 [Phycisphaerae bacterium RAS1]
MLRDGVDGLSGHPTISDIRHRYDSESDSLIVRCNAAAAGGLERVYLLPLYKGVEPYGAVPNEENPLFHERWGGGVNFSTLFSPVEGRADTYERVIWLDGKSALVGGDFALRIIAVDKTGTRTAFRDIVPIP